MDNETAILQLRILKDDLRHLWQSADTLRFHDWEGDAADAVEHYLKRVVASLEDSIEDVKCAIEELKEGR